MAKPNQRQRNHSIWALLHRDMVTIAADNGDVGGLNTTITVDLSALNVDSGYTDADSNPLTWREWIDQVTDNTHAFHVEPVFDDLGVEIVPTRGQKARWFVGSVFRYCSDLWISVQTRNAARAARELARARVITQVPDDDSP